MSLYYLNLVLPFLALIVTVLQTCYLKRTQKRRISVSWGDTGFVLQGYSHKATIDLGTDMIEDRYGLSKKKFLSRVWRR